MALLGLHDDERRLAWTQVAELALGQRVKAITYVLGTSPERAAFAVYRGDGSCGRSTAYLIDTAAAEVDRAEIVLCDFNDARTKKAMAEWEAHVKRWVRHFDLAAARGRPGPHAKPPDAAVTGSDGIVVPVLFAGGAKTAWISVRRISDNDVNTNFYVTRSR
ncbi:MAG: hypothetical protein ACXWLM_00065 [Myxococcales bacterium]